MFVVAISSADAQQFGCPNCGERGCGFVTYGILGGVEPTECGECGTDYYVLPPKMEASPVAVINDEGAKVYLRLEPHPRRLLEPRSSE